jgi:hypothetical protein
MLEPYFDESGIHDGAAMCIFGYASQWRAFESKWLKILANHHFALSEFHATELLESQRHQPMLKQVAVHRVGLIGICSLRPR